MAGLLFIEGLGVLLAAASPASTTQAVGVEDASNPQAVAVSAAYKAAATRVRTRDERIGTAALRGFPASEGWVPPAKTWGDAGGPVFEVGALGARRSGQPDLAHLSFNWQF
jgi:hypothetical protein